MPHFQLKVEDIINYICFFKNDRGEFNKKHYLYVTVDGKFHMSGLSVLKSDCSEISKHIFNKHLKQQIIDRLDSKFPRNYIMGLIYDLIEEDITILAKQFNIGDTTQYKNDTSLQAQIKAKYGVGSTKLIKNKKFGVGKAVKYCSLKEAKEHGLKPEDMDLVTVLKELGLFIKKEEVTNPQQKLEV